MKRYHAREVNADLKKVAGQDSYLLASNQVELAITRTGGMMAPVSFFPAERSPIEPYHVAPWAEEQLPADSPPMLRALRGDWFCSAFGENKEGYARRANTAPVNLLPHGETANRDWQLLTRSTSDAGSWLHLGMDMPLQGGRCESITALLPDRSVIYQRHDLTGLGGAINPGHHATLQFRDSEGSGRFSCSALSYARTYAEPIDGTPSHAYSCLQPGSSISDLSRAPTVGGLVTDLRRYPARRGFDDIVILCADPMLAVAWSAVTFPEEGFVWFALRSPRQLASTLLWFSNGGRRFPPWNGRHRNVMGIEDVTAFFHVGLAASTRENPLTKLGIRTCLDPDPEGRLSIPYIQGVAKIPRGFDRVAKIEPLPGTQQLCLQSDAGPMVTTSCDLNFLCTGQLSGLEMP